MSEYSGPSGALIPFEVGQDSVVMWKTTSLRDFALSDPKRKPSQDIS